MNNEKLLLSASECTHLLGISRSAFYASLQTGAIGPRGIKIGGRRLWPVQELRDWVAAGCPKFDTWRELRKDKTC